jgi:hypothetical protein
MVTEDAWENSEMCLLQYSRIMDRYCLASVLIDPFFTIQKTVHKSNITPFICREGCKHYDGVTDVNDGNFKEFCCYGRRCRIEGSRSCNHFEDKNQVYDEEDGILRF